MLLLRYDSNASIEMHHEELYDHVNLFLMLRAFSQLVLQVSGNQCSKLVK